MKVRPLAFCLSLLLSACETFAPVRREPVLPGRTSPLGTALLFKLALDSGRIADATALLASSDGTPLLAEQRYELFPDIERLGRLVARLPVTFTRTDTLGTTATVWLEIDYRQTLRFALLRRDSLWAITALERIPWNRPPVPVFPTTAE
jgi:hypothetical protein